MTMHKSAPTRVSSVETALLYATDSATLIHLILHLFSFFKVSLSLPESTRCRSRCRGELSTSRFWRFAAGTEPRYPLNRMLGGLQSRSGLLEKRKKTVALAWNRTPDRPTHSLVIYRLAIPAPIFHQEEKSKGYEIVLLSVYFLPV